ncbi:MAG: hypothetical protein IJ792_01745 [Oscillospiraceae bacterium]|nr:hypothetical protein [Oscillospiraceae bacterium]
MKTTYQEYMDRQTVSPDLHRRLLALEQEQSVRALPKTQHSRWRSAAALAASLVLVVGLGFFVTRSGLLSRGGLATADHFSAMESAADAQAPAAAKASMEETESGEYGFEMETAEAEAATADVDQEASIPAFEEPEEEADDSRWAWAEQNAALLMETLPFADENAVLGAAQQLEQAGCGPIAKIEVEEDDGRVYVLTLTDEEQKVFRTVMNYEGYIGPIQDEEGNYLYAPID